MNARYGDTDITATFTYDEWSLILTALRKQRDGLHHRADSLEATGLAEVNQTELASLRHKASALFGLIEDVMQMQHEVRAEDARAKEAKEASS